MTRSDDEMRRRQVRRRIRETLALRRAAARLVARSAGPGEPVGPATPDADEVGGAA